MANYSIWVLGESQISVSGGVSLDGITQGDGSHLVGNTITLNSNAWQQVQVRDGGSDTNFEDNDRNQRLDGNQTIDGISYNDGTRVEAEYQFEVTDGTDTYTLVAFNLNNSSPAYGTNEGLAFFGGFPPVGVPLSVTSAQEGPQGNIADESNYATPPCFTAGTRILTLDGELPIDWLQVGDRIVTRDHGAQELLWIGRVYLGPERLAQDPKARPIRIRKDTFGPGKPNRDVLFSPQHRILVRDERAELFFGDAEVLVAAQHLIDDRAVRRACDVREVTYYHLLFEQHEIVYADGLETESFQPGPMVLPSFSRETQDEIIRFFPELARGRPSDIAAARMPLRSWEAELLSI